MHEPCLQWVRVDNEIHHVSEYSDLEPCQRPEAYCPICERPVLLKLGEIRTHHAAHSEGAICTTTQPETVIHLNSKYYLKQVLDSTNRVNIWQYCYGWMEEADLASCYAENKHQVTYLQGWDRVEVEWQLGRYRLDLALLKDQHIVGAIEILVTHPSEQRKIEYLNERRIAWLEIKVSPEFYTERTAWTSEVPLEAVNYNKSLLADWQCEECRSSEDEYKKQIEQFKRDQEEQKRKYEYARQFETIAVRLVDFYYPSGKKYRSIFILQNKVKDGQVVYSELQELGSQRRTVATETAPIPHISHKRLKVHLELEIKRKKNSATIVDDSSKWIDKPERFHPKKFLDLDRYPFHYQLVDGKWKKYEPKSYSTDYPKLTSHYFVPRELDISPHRPETPKSTNHNALLDHEYPCEKCGKVTSDWVSSNGAKKTCICRECAYSIK